MAPLERAPKDKLRKKLMIAERALEDVRAWHQTQPDWQPSNHPTAEIAVAD